MMRIRITNGIASTDQVRALADITRRFGRDILDITTRQQIELRWITIDAVPEILEILYSVGLCSLQTGMDNIRNVIGCPLAGLAPSELFDASPVARDFTARFVRNREFSNLPRKFNVAITGCRENCVHAESQDIALVPATVEASSGRQIVGFNVFVGGKMGSGGYRVASDLDIFVEPADAAELCAAITLIFRDFGARDARSKARLSFLLEERGEPWLRGILEQRLGHPLGRTGRDERTSAQADHIGVAPQKQPGLSSVGLLVPVGRIRVHQLEEAVRLADTYGDSQLRFTTSQSLIIPNVPSKRVPEFLVEPLLEELSPSPSPAMRGLVSCTGMDFCKLALIDTKTRAVALATQLEVSDTSGGEPVRIHWSGCPAGCGNHEVADIGLEGKRIRRNGEVIEAVDVYVGGRSGPRGQRASRVLEDIPCDELLPVLQGLMDKQQPAATVETSQQLAVNLA
jgi:ferredoxin-nitrite reductase